MLKKMFKYAISASLALGTFGNVLPMTVLAEEVETISTALAPRFGSNLVVDRWDGDHLELIRGFAAEKYFTYSADVRFTNLDEQQSVALVFGIKDGNMDDANAMKANIHKRIDWNRPARVWGYGTVERVCPGESGATNTYFEENGVDVTQPFHMEVTVSNVEGKSYLKYTVNNIGKDPVVMCEGELKDSYQGGQFGVMTYASGVEFSDVTVTGENNGVQKYGTFETDGLNTKVIGTNGDAHMIMEGAGIVKEFTYESDIQLLPSSTSAALTFGIQDPNAPGASWIGANFNFNDDSSRVFTVNSTASLSGTTQATGLSSTIDRTQTIHAKLAVKEDGSVQWTLNNTATPAQVITVNTKLDNYNGGYLGALTFDSSAIFSNVSVSTEPIVDSDPGTDPDPGENPEPIDQGLMDFLNIGGASMNIDEEAGTITLEKDGDHFAMYNGLEKKANDFTLEANVSFANVDADNSAALVFGTSTKENPASKWYAANVDTRRASERDLFRVFGAGSDIGKMSSTISDINLKQPLHLKLDVKQNGAYTYTFSNVGQDNEHSFTGTIPSWQGGYVGILSFESTATFSNIHFEDRTVRAASDITELEMNDNWKTNLEDVGYKNGDWTITENGLYSDASDKGDAFLVTESMGTNFVYQTDIHFDSNTGAAALMFRSNNNLDKKEAYCVNLDVSSHKAKFWRWQNDEALQLIDERSVARTVDETYTLKVVAYNEWISYYINDVLVANLGDYTLQVGDLGQNTIITNGYFGLLNWNSKVTFQNTYYQEMSNNFNPTLDSLSVTPVTGAKSIVDASQFRPTEPMLLQYVKNDADKVIINATSSRGNEVTIKDANGNTYAVGDEIPVNVGINYLSVISTATENGASASFTYKVNVHRLQPEDVYYNETYRDQYHYSVKEGWANDPNGLVYYNGTYHMFYQFYDDIAWGPMHWAHATSTDLINWTDQPIAFYPDANGAMFSGCIVADETNSSGLFKTDKGGLVALITADGNGQRIKVAYSEDEGKTWTKLDKVAADWTNDPLKSRDFRDPKVFRWENKWFMVVAGGPLRIYSSDNLLDWTCESTYRNINTECPDLYPVQVDGQVKWILSRGGRLYKVGDLTQVNGKWTYVPDAAYASKDGVMNFGKDSYAAMTYYVQDFGTAENPTIPEIVELNWMNTWDNYCNQVASSVGQKFNGTFNLNLKLGLVDQDGTYVLTQTPISAYEGLRDEEKATVLKDVTVSESNNLFSNFAGSTYEIVAHFTPGENTTEIGFNVRVGEGEKTVVKYNLTNNTFTIDRSQSGIIITSVFKQDMVQNNVTRNADGSIDMHIYVDRASVEAFTSDYKVAGAAQIFPSATSEGLEVYALGEDTKADITVYPLDTIWTDKVTPELPTNIGLSTTNITTFIGETTNVKVWLEPKELSQEFVVTNTNPEVATAVASKGKIAVTGVGKGETTITVISVANPELTKEIKVSVTRNAFGTNVDLINAGGGWYIDGEELKESNSSSNDFYMSATPVGSGSFVLETDVKYSTGLVNIFFASESTDPFANGGAYSIQLTTSRQVRLFRFGGSNIATANAPARLNDGKYHHVKIEKNESQVTVYIDGNKIIDRAVTNTKPYFNNNTYVGVGLWDGEVSIKNFFVFYETPEAGWTKYGNVWYYFDEEGMYSGWLKDNNKWYYLNPNMVTGYIEVEGVPFYMNDNGTLFNGGWKKVDDTWYYFKSTGALNGWQKIDGKWYFFKDYKMTTGLQSDGEDLYYLGTNGAMQTGWIKVDGTWYYFSNKAKTGWYKENGIWYYLKPQMASNERVDVDGVMYSFAKSGAMQTGWIQDSEGNWKYYNEKGAEVSGWVKYNNKWYYLDAENDNIMVYDCQMEIDGVMYAFNIKGAWVK